MLYGRIKGLKNLRRMSLLKRQIILSQNEEYKEELDYIMNEL